MGSDSTFEQVDQSLLTPVVEKLLGRRGITLADWSGSSVRYTTFLSGRALQSYWGTAITAGERIPWRLILKIIRPPSAEQANATSNLPWTREVDAYRSGLLDDLPGNLRAPRAVHIADDASGAHWLWLEHIADLYERRWPLAAFGVAARHLGQFNGAYLTERSLPTVPWLMTGWAEWNSEPARAAVVLPLLDELLADSRVQSAFPTTITARARRLVRDQPRYLASLASLPQTLCHHDVAQANLFAHRRTDGEIESVAIDWEFIGPGTIAADLAGLVFGTLRRGDVPSTDAEELERLAFAGYVAGLHDVGWQGSTDLVRLAYVATVTLRWSLLLGTLRAVVNDAARAKAARDWNYSPEIVLRQWIPLSIYLLDRADEAASLLDG